MAECIQSLFNQTYKDFEIIVIDDCGTDDSMAKVRACIARNGLVRLQHCDAERYGSSGCGIEVRIVTHSANMGLSEARNSGIRAANGHYLFFLDSDDKVTPNCIALLEEQTRLHPGVDFVQCGMWSDDPKMNRYLHDFVDYFHVPLYMEGRKCRSILYGRQLGLMANGRMVSRKFVNENHLFFKPGIIHEDDEWSFRVAKHINSYSYIPEEIFFYRRNPNGIMAHSHQERAYTSMCGIADEILDQLPSFRYYFTELLFAVREMNLAWENAGVNPLDYMKYGKNVLIRGIYKHWNGGKVKKTVVFFLFGMAFWGNRFLLDKGE